MCAMTLRSPGQIKTGAMVTENPVQKKKKSFLGQKFRTRGHRDLALTPLGSLMPVFETFFYLSKFLRLPEIKSQVELVGNIKFSENHKFLRN